MSRFLIPLVFGLIIAVLCRLVLDMSPGQALVFAFIFTPMAYLIFYLHGRWRARTDERFVDAVVQGLIKTSREERELPPVIAVSLETIRAQQEVESRLRDTEACIVRSKLRFIQRPTKEDIQAAEEDDAVIVVRVPVPERWRASMTKLDVHKRIIGRCNAILETLGLVGGHPRVMLLSDTCESKVMFTEKVYERFGA